MSDQLRIDKLLESINSCINGILYDAYDYRKFFPGWEFESNISYHSLIKNAFDLQESEVESFIGEQHQSYFSLVCNLNRMDTDISIKVLRYALCLPMMDYELSTPYPTPATGSVSNDKFSKTLERFIFDQRCAEEIKYDEVRQTIEEIISSSSIRNVCKRLEDLAFRDHEVVYRHLSTETTYKDIFRDYLAEPICKLLANATGYDIKIVGLISLVQYESNCDRRCKVWSDLYLVFNVVNDTQQSKFVTREVCCTIEVKPFPMIPYVYGPPQMRFGFFSMGRIPAYMRQAILQLIYHWINYGIISDSNTTCCFIIDLNLFESNKEAFYNSINSHGDRLVPLKYLLLNNFSSLPSIKESLLFHFFKSVITFLRMENRKERMRQFRLYLQKSNQESSHEGLSEIYSSGNESMFESQPDSSFSGEYSSYSGHHSSYHSEANLEIIDEVEQEENILEFDPNDDIYVQNGLLFNTQIFKIDAKYLKKYLVEEMEDEKKIIVKIYDYEISRMTNEATNRDENREAILDSIKGYKIESSILKELHEDKEFNSCYIPHNGRQILIKANGREVSGGRFNLLRYIDTIPLPKDLETYMKAKQQLDIIHKHGIAHQDIKEGNILYSRDKVVYIIDFQYSFRVKHEICRSKISDMRDLKSIFGIKDDS